MNDYVREVTQAAKIAHAALLRRIEMDKMFEAHVMQIKERLGITEPFNHPRILEHHADGDPILSSWQYLFAPKGWTDGPLLLGVVSKRGASELLLTLVDRSDDAPFVTEYVFDLESHLDRVSQHGKRRSNSRGENLPPNM